MPIYTTEFINLTAEGLVLFITFLVNLTIALVVFFKNPRKRVNVVFGAIVSLIALWNLTNFLSDSLQNFKISLFFGYSTMGSVLFVPALFLLFVLIFTRKEKISSKKIFFILLPALILVPMLPTEYNIISSTYKITNWGSDFTAGLLYLFYAIYFLIYMFASFTILFIGYKKSSSRIFRQQLLYIFCGLCITGVVGIITNNLFPYFGGTARYSIYGTPTSIIFGMCTAYAITRYRFMDIKVVLRKSFVYGLGVLVLVGLVVGGGIIIERVLEVYLNMSQSVAIILGVAFIVIVFPSLKGHVKNKLDQVFKKDYIDLGKKFEEFEAQGLITNIRIENFCQELSVEIKHTLKLSSLYFFVLGVQSQKLEQLFPKNKDINIKKDDQLIKILDKTKGIIIKEELSYFKDGQIERRNGVSELEEKEVSQLIKLMNKKELEFIVPLKYGGEMIGFLSGGKRDDAESFSSEDIELFEYVQDRTKVVLGQLRQRNNFLR